jgi:site-specific DNA recombinase
MKNVLIYSRVSTDEQANQGYSIEYQEEVITRYCNLKGYNILEKYREDYTGTHFNRPKWKKIKLLIKENKKSKNSIDAIVILRPDRFARNMILAFMEVKELSELGCNVEFLEQDMNFSNPEELLIQAINFALPEIENHKTSKRSKEGSHRARLNGCFTGTAPRGYKSTRVGKDATLEFSNDADLIREAFEKMASGLYTADEVRRWLNGQGMKLSKNQFPNIIRNLTYSGKILVRAFGNQPEQIVQGLHPALVSEELFAKANDVLNGRKRNMDFKSDKLNLYPLKGHLCCPTHGRTLSAYASTGRSNKYHYYICTKPHVKCDRYPVEEVHSQIERILSNIQFSAQLVSSYRSVLEGLFESDDVNRKKSVQKSLDEIEKLNKRRLFIEEQYMDGELPAQEYQDLKNNINTRLFNEKNNLQQLQEVLSPFREYLDKQVPMLEDLVGFYKSVDGRTKNKILGCIFSEKLYFEEKKVATPKFTTPIELLLNASKVLQNCKNKKEVKNDLFSQFAPPLGLEPRTL